MSKLKDLFKGAGKKDPSGEGARSSGNPADPGKPVVYRCPMKCEGDKTYAEPGKCPVCGMFLTPGVTGSHKQ